MSSDTLPSWPPEVRELQLGELVVDLRYRHVTSAGTTTELPQRPFDLLCLLIGEPGRLHTRAELFRRLWKGAVVEDANLSQSVWLVRNALGDYAKPWLRTIAKGGYVFEPPAGIDVVAVAETLATDIPEATAEALPPVGPRRRIALARAVLLVAVAAVLIAVAWHWQRTQVGREPVRVVLVDADDERSASAPARHWAVAFTHAWIEWKLAGEPGAVVVDAPRLARDGQADTALVSIVLLSATPVPGDASRVNLRAHVVGAGQRRDFAETAALADIAPRIDALTSAVVSALVPRPVALDGPPLDLDAEAAQRYVEALALRDARRPADAVRAFDGVIRDAPQFGLARVQQAALLGELGQLGAAREQMRSAEAWIARLPPPVAEIVNAQRLAIQRDYAEAAVAYGALAQRHPQQPAYAIEQARALVGAARADDALHALDAIHWAREPTALALDALIVRAQAESNGGYLDHAIQSARRADEIAERAAWPRQRGQALLTFANATQFAGSNTDTTALFERAAVQFEAAGDRLGALRARLHGQSRRANPDPDRLQHALDEARAAGNTELEVLALRSEALRYAFRGEFKATRGLLARATAVAEASGDLRKMRGLQFETLQADVYLADYAAADRDLAALDGVKLQGLLHINVGKLAATVALRRGRYDVATATLARYRADAADAAAYDADYGALDTELALRRGDLAAARLASERCATGPIVTTALTCEVLLAAVASLGGDAAAALAKLDAIRARLDPLPDDTNRWELESLYARERTRAGDPTDAETRLAALRERLHTRDLPLLYADTLLTSVEAALRRGRLGDAAAWLGQARERLPAGDWLGGARATILEAILRHRRGDAQAFDGLPALAQEAHRQGDALVELFALTLPAAAAGKEPPARALELAARSGIRGVLVRPELIGGSAPGQ